MNQTALKLHLKQTRFANPHGLSDKANHSTATELAILSAAVMKIPLTTNRQQATVAPKAGR